jgi:hypothetical protein
MRAIDPARVMSHSFFPSDADTGSRKLMRAVLLDAVNEITKAHRGDGRLSKRHEELEAWFASEDRTPSLLVLGYL